MRPPSYYTSIANSNTSSSQRNSTKQLRSTLTSSPSSSYVNRTHLPFVAQSTLVAHCFTGAGSTTKPYNQPNYSTSRSYVTSYSRPKSIKQTPSSYLSSSSNLSYSTKSRSSYLTSTNLSSTFHYRPTTPTYYKPIKLRERPILTQISNQIRTRNVSSSRRISIKSSNEKIKLPQVTIDNDSEATWSSDIARNISRNKYLIKFREIDKQNKTCDFNTKQSKEIEPYQIKDTNTSSNLDPLIKIDDKEGQNNLKLNEIECCDKIDNPEDETLILNELNETKEKVKVKKEEEEENDKEKEKEKVSDKIKPKRNLKLKIKNSNKLTNLETDSEREKKSNLINEDKQTSTSGNEIKTKVKRLVKLNKDKNKDKVQESNKENETTKSKVDQLSESSKLTKSAKVEVSKTNSIEDKNDHKSNSSAEISNKRIRFRDYHFEDFNFLSVLGHGGWGFVILAELKNHDASFAVKCIKKITIVEDDDFDSILIERKVLTLGNIHPFICKLFCTFETEGYLFFVMEFCAGGDLMFHVQREGKFSESRCRFYAAEIICAIKFLHNRHIIYRDLKLDNILLDSLGHIRLVDFGMCQCRTYREELLPSNFCGTPEYISPEIIKGVPYNHSVDWWSFGVLLYEMAVGKMPFRGNDENELLWNVCYEKIHYPMFLSRELTNLLQALLEREPSKRMGMATCKLGDIHEQLWFKGLDWAAVEALRIEPPFVPEVRSKRDVQNFDSDFTESEPTLSPVDQATLNKIDQNQFHKFPYTNPDISVFDTP